MSFREKERKKKECAHLSVLLPFRLFLSLPTPSVPLSLLLFLIFLIPSSPSGFLLFLPFRLFLIPPTPAFLLSFLTFHFHIFCLEKNKQTYI